MRALSRHNTNFRIVPVNPPGPYLEFQMIGQAELSGGLGGWEVVDRPRKRGVPEWTGVDPFRITVPAASSRFDMPSRTGTGTVNESIEDKLMGLMTAAWKIPGGTQPPVHRLEGPLPVFGSIQNLWVIEDVEWGEEVRRSDGLVIQQFFVIRFLQYLETTVITGPAAAAQVRQSAPKPAVDLAGRARTDPNFGKDPQFYTVKKGDTLSSIAARQLGNASRWRELAQINKLPNPNLIRVGQVLKLYV